MSETLSLDDVINSICDTLVETDEKYRAHVASVIGAEYSNDDQAVSAISDVLSDPSTDAAIIIRVANETLTGTFSYDGDSIVTVEKPDNAPSP